MASRHRQRRERVLAPRLALDEHAFGEMIFGSGQKVALAVLSGTALAALGGLLLSLLAVYLLLVDVFGISIELTPMRSR